VQIKPSQDRTLTVQSKAPIRSLAQIPIYTGNIDTGRQVNAKA
jgi:hypothetical protein